MAKLLTLRCPECKGTFDFLRHPTTEPLPNRCELCGASMGDDPKPEPVLHISLRTAKGQMPEKVYRQMESASIERAEAAADMAGCSVSEMSAIKITDMKDNMREGDIAAVTPVAAQRRISQEAERAQAQLTVRGSGARPGFQGTNGSQWAGETTSGAHALTGRATIDGIQKGGLAKQQISIATRQGQMGKA